MDVELDIEEFRKWFPGLTEEAISDAVLDVLWQQVCALLGNTDATKKYVRRECLKQGAAETRCRKTQDPQ